MCTSHLCNDNDYDITQDSSKLLLRKQIGQQQILSSTIAEGEIENSYTNDINNESPSDISSKLSTSLLLFLNPFPPKQHTLPSKTHPSTTNAQNTSIETSFVDTSIKALGTQNDFLDKHSETPREEALFDRIEEDHSIFEDLSFESEEDEDVLDSILPKHRVPRQAQGEKSHINILFFISCNFVQK